MRSIPSRRFFLNVAFETIPMFVLLTIALSQGRSSSSSSFHACPLQSIDGVMSLALCPQVVYQAPQHLPTSKPLVMGACSRQSICSVISIHSDWHVKPRGVFEGGCMSTIETFQSGLPIPLFAFRSTLTERARETGQSRTNYEISNFPPCAWCGHHSYQARKT